jgi:hypothetical protein
MEGERVAILKWKKVIKSMTHKRAVWEIPVPETNQTWCLDSFEGEITTFAISDTLFCFDRFPSFDQTLNITFFVLPEGPCRMRARLKKVSKNKTATNLNETEPPLRTTRSPSLMHRYLEMKTDASARESFLRDLTVKAIIQPSEKVTFHAKSLRISPFRKSAGEFVVGTKSMYFIDKDITPTAITGIFGMALEKRDSLQSLSDDAPSKHVTWTIDSIREIHRRRYLLRDTGVEFFLMNGRTVFISFQLVEERESLIKHVSLRFF